MRIHPITGRRVLYSPCGTNLGVVGWSSARSFELLSRLMEHCLQPHYRHDHMYSVGDIVRPTLRCPALRTAVHRAIGCM